MGMASRISAASNRILQSHHETGAFPSTRGPGKQVLDDAELMECFFQHWSFLPIGISAPWNQTSQIFPTTPQCLDFASFPFSCFKYLLQSSWWENSFVLKACKLKTGIKQLSLRTFWRSQGRERSCCCCLLELLLGREGWSLLHFFGGRSEHLFSLTTHDDARKYSCVEHQGSAVPCRKTELPAIGLREELIFQFDSKIEKSSGKIPFCLDHARILFLLLNQIHCSIQSQIEWLIYSGREIHKHLTEPEDCISSCLEILIFLWKFHIPRGWSHDSIKTRNVPCPAVPGCKWWESVDQGNDPILPSFPFLNAFRTLFHHSSH